MPTRRIHPNEPQDQLDQEPKSSGLGWNPASWFASLREATEPRVIPLEGEPFDLPFLYEIRVKGRLDKDQWTEWFDKLNVTHKRGETILRGEVPDHAGLYGLLARLRDLAVPLVAVRVLDSEAQLKLNKKLRRYRFWINSLIAAIYLLILGGLVTATVFLSMAINVALALLLLFAALAGFAQAFYLWSGAKFWRWVFWCMGVSALVSAIVWIPVSNVLPLWISLPVTFAVLAGLVYYGIESLRRRAEDLRRSAFSDDTTGSDSALYE